MTPRHDAILFDLFGTLVFFDDDRLPRLQVEGSSAIMTVRSLPALLNRYATGIGVAGFLQLLQEVGAELADVKRRTGVEILTHVRFERALLRAGSAARDAAEGAMAMAAQHMESLAQAVVCPQDRVTLLEELSERYRIGLVSNFDDGPTGRRVLAEHGLARLLETVIISAEVGLRKPSSELFTRACMNLSLPPQACLYVGDTWREDIEGSAAAGLSPVWITREPVAAAPALARIGDVWELPQLLASQGW